MMRGDRSGRSPKALVFAPYLHTLGGGERVVVSIAQLLESSFDVRLFGPRPRDLARWERLGFPDTTVGVMNARQFSKRSWRASLVVTMTNHVPLPSFSRRSFLIVQFPTDDLSQQPILTRALGHLSLRTYHVLTYSEFNARYISQRWGIKDVSVLAPPVRQVPYRIGEKTETILSVGRFSTDVNHKRHDALLDAWALLRPKLPSWRLVLAGAGSETQPYVQRLRDRAVQIGGVTIHVDAPADIMEGLYRSASIYWHATGFERPPDRPEMAEHFGISTVQAMSAGAVPIVFADGGQPEIVAGTAGLVWTDLSGLVAASEALARDPVRRHRAAENVSRAAQRYAPEAFAERALNLFGVLPQSGRPGQSSSDHVG